MSEIIFLVEEDPEGGYSAHALGQSIFTEGETWDELKKNVQEAVACHFEETDCISPVLLKVGQAFLPV